MTAGGTRRAGRMGVRSGAFVVGVAVVLGALTGVFLLPDPGTVFATLGPTPGAGVPASTPSATSSDKSTAAPSPSGSGSDSDSTTPQASPTAGSTTGQGPVRQENLVTVDAFAEAGQTVSVYPMNGATEPKNPVSSCTAEREVGAQTLADLTGRDPALAGNWDNADGSGTAYEVLAVAESPELAEVYAKRLTAAQTICQDEPAGHFVYGPVHTEKVAAGSSARWVGRWEGKQNTTGRAPEDTEPCGGTVIAANGTHFAVLEIYFCVDSAGLAVLAKNAAEQLG